MVNSNGDFHRNTHKHSGAISFSEYNGVKVEKSFFERVLLEGSPVSLMSSSEWEGAGPEGRREHGGDGSDRSEKQRAGIEAHGVRAASSPGIACVLVRRVKISKNRDGVRQCDEMPSVCS